MADLDPLFKILDDGSGGGVAPASKVEGDAPGIGLVGFSFKDNAGNLVLPTLNSDGTIPVDTGAAGTCVNARGELAAPTTASTLELVTGAEITLTASEVYKQLGVIASSTVPSHFVLEHISDEGGGGEAITVLADVYTGPGQYTADAQLECLEFTAGAVGVQKLRLRVEQVGTLACARGTITALEVA